MKSTSSWVVSVGVASLAFYTSTARAQSNDKSAAHPEGDRPPTENVWAPWPGYDKAQTDAARNAQKAQPDTSKAQPSAGPATSPLPALPASTKALTDTPVAAEAAVAPSPAAATPAPVAAPAPQPQPPRAERPSGEWQYTEAYGWVWIPAGTNAVAVGSEPYVYVYTPAYGWTWYVSPWGWGPYYVGPWLHGPWRYSPRVWGGARGWYTPHGYVGRAGGWHGGGAWHGGGGFRGGFHGGGFHGGHR